MYCSKCGTELQEDDNFCAKCGSPTNRPSEKGDKLPELSLESELAKLESAPQSGSPEQKRSWLVSTPMYVISWIALIGSIFAVVLGSHSPQGGWALSFWCGVIMSL